MVHSLKDEKTSNNSRTQYNYTVKKIILFILKHIHNTP